ncbi:amp dependent CoA ligase [Abortiporus biennis]|nr:amp dependent CoA ligase [Abortiporus biennis]
MSEFLPLHRPLPIIPDDLTTSQFMLDGYHSQRPLRTELKPWFVEELTGRQIGFEEIRARTFSFANELKARWDIVGEDDVVCIFSPNHVDYPIVIWGTHRLGAIISTVNPAYTVNELSHQISVAKAKLLIAHSSCLKIAEITAKATGIPSSNIILMDSEANEDTDHTYPTIDSIIHSGHSKHATFIERRLGPGEGKTKIAFLCSSSGTTGKPKLITIPHTSIIAAVVQMAYHARVTEMGFSNIEGKWRVGDIAYAVLPFYHIYGLLTILHFYSFIGNTLVISPKFVFKRMLKSVEGYRINHLLLVPPMIVFLCKNQLDVKKYDLSSLRVVLSGAAPLSSELTNQLSKLLPGVDIGQGYGTSSTEAFVSLIHPFQKINTPGSAGHLLPGIVVKLVKRDGSLAGFGEPGELYVKSPSRALRYLDNEEATKETFVDGWVRMGDEVIINEMRELFVVDRIKEIMKVKGFQVAPAELEGHLLEHPDVSDTCVVGIPDDYSGELPLAFVVPSQSAAQKMMNNPEQTEKVKASIIKHVSDHKAHYKRLHGVVFVDVIPKSPSGKLLRRLLKEKAKSLMMVARPTTSKL